MRFQNVSRARIVSSGVGLERYSRSETRNDFRQYSQFSGRRNPADDGALFNRPSTEWPKRNWRSGTGDKLLVRDVWSGNALTGYASSALNFKFENRPKLEKSKAE
jgi:hypothetical protein